MKTKKTLLILSALTFLFITRFVNLTWGQPFFFHPDERNIASSISQLIVPTSLNPHFFAYGSFPLYVIYFSGVLLNLLSNCHMPNFPCHQVPFEQALILSRLWSALFSVLSVVLLFMISKKITTEKNAWIVTFLSIFSTGFIQFAHFGTFEMWTIFFSLLLCYQLIKHSLNYKQIFFLGVIVGILISIKIANLVFLPVITLFFFLTIFHSFIHKQHRISSLRIFCKQMLLFCVTTGFVYFITNPYVLLDTKEFLSSITYETQVATGTLPVFYTQEFFATIPIIYQLLHVFPFLLSPVLTILFPFIFLGFLFSSWKTKKTTLGIITVFFLVSFISQAFLFTKWTRYTVTCLPFFFLMIPSFLELVSQKKKSLLFPLIIMLLGSNMFFSLSYVSLVFFREDVRVLAAKHAQKSIPSDVAILSEVYDMGIVPFNAAFSHISLFNFYDLETDLSAPSALSDVLKNTPYVILPSQRLVKTRLQDPFRFSKGNMFYQELTTNPHKYQKIYQTPCDILCKIVYLGDPINRFETTANVFDRPIIQIYKKL